MKKEEAKYKEFITVYCDESRQTNSRWMLLGSVWIPRKLEEEFEKICFEFRQKTRNSKAYFKWTKVSKGKLDAYKGLVDLFFKFGDMRFKCLLIDTHQLDFDGYHHGDYELGFYRFYFYLLSRTMIKDNQYFVLLHRKDNKKRGRLGDLKNHLNEYFRARFLVDRDVVSNVEPRDARLYNQLQIVDVLLGAVGYVWEGYELSPAKLELIKHIEIHRGKKLAVVSLPSERKFNIWNIKLSPKKEKTP
jgi:hypothetical protein